MKYANLSGRSGVTDYEVSPDNKSVSVTFKNGKTYTYSAEDNSDYIISQMAAYGNHGEYLNRMINRDKPAYSIGNSAGRGAPNSGRSTLSAEEEKAMSSIHAKSIFGAPKMSLQDAVKVALEKTQNQKMYRDLRKYSK